MLWILSPGYIVASSAEFKIGNTNPRGPNSDLEWGRAQVFFQGSSDVSNTEQESVISD